MSNLAAVQPRRTVDLVADRLRNAIIDGTFAPGAALPAERALAVELGVSRLTLRAAIARLQSEGLLAPRQGDAVRARDWRHDATLALLPHLPPSLALARGFLELRRAIASEAVALACSRATAADFASLRKLAEAQLAEQDEAAFRERDLAFARALLAVARNDAMLLLLNTIEGVYRQQPEIADALLADREAVRASYGAVIALVETGDPETGRRVVREVLAEQDSKALRRLARAWRAS